MEFDDYYTYLLIIRPSCERKCVFKRRKASERVRWENIFLFFFFKKKSIRWLAETENFILRGPCAEWVQRVSRPIVHFPVGASSLHMGLRTLTYTDDLTTCTKYTKTKYCQFRIVCLFYEKINVIIMWFS